MFLCGCRWWVGGLVDFCSVHDPCDAAPCGFFDACGRGSDGRAKKCGTGSHGFDPGVGVDLESFKDGLEVGGYFSALAVFDDASGGVDEFQIIVDGDGSAGQWIVAGGAAFERSGPEAVLVVLRVAESCGSDECRRHLGGSSTKAHGALIALADPDTFLNRGVIAVLGSGGHFSAYGIEVDIGHGCDDGSLVEERDRCEASFPEMAGDVVFFVGPTGQAFFDGFHEPTDGREAGAYAFDPRAVVGQLLNILYGGWFDFTECIAFGIDLAPAFSDLKGCPFGGLSGVGLYHNVEMIAHRAPAEHVDGERLAHGLYLFGNPLTPMAVSVAGQECATHAP